MQPDAARRADTLAWLRKAEGDLRAASVDLAADPPLLDDALFHCQQAVEKALKGLLTWHDVPFRKTHSLEELGRQVVALHGDLRPIVDRASPLSEYAWKFRYPGEVDPPSLAEATDALALAREAHAAVLAAVGERLF
jgi:HEPN domain-containing protein